MDKRVPEVRFKGFTDDWEQHKLGEYLNLINGRAFKQSELLDEGKYKVLRVGNFNTNTRWYYSNLELPDDKYAENGDLLYLWATNFGPELWKSTKVIFHYHIWKIQFKTDSLDKKYIFYWLKLDKENLKKDLNGSTMVHITKENMENRFLDIPLQISEQKKIGSILNSLNDLINTQEKQLLLYESLKKYMLQNLFPTIEERKSNLIFTSSNTTWKQYYLFDVINKIIDFRGLTPKKLGLDWSKDGILALSALNVKNNYIDKDINIHYGNELLYSKWMKDTHLHKGQVLMTTEAPMGNVAQVPDKNKYILSQRVIAFDTNEQKITDDFLAITLHTTRVFNDLLSLSSGGTAKGVSQRSLSQLKINIPSNIDYQNDISDYYKLLNKKISETQSHLHSYKMLKKYFLQKLFL